jgi:hypothetical protein
MAKRPNKKRCGQPHQSKPHNQSVTAHQQPDGKRSNESQHSKFLRILLIWVEALVALSAAAYLLGYSLGGNPVGQLMLGSLVLMAGSHVIVNVIAILRRTLRGVPLAMLPLTAALIGCCCCFFVGGVALYRYFNAPKKNSASDSRSAPTNSNATTTETTGESSDIAGYIRLALAGLILHTTQPCALILSVTKVSRAKTGIVKVLIKYLFGVRKASRYPGTSCPAQ